MCWLLPSWSWHGRCHCSPLQTIIPKQIFVTTIHLSILSLVCSCWQSLAKTVHWITNGVAKATIPPCNDNTCGNLRSALCAIQVKCQTFAWPKIIVSVICQEKIDKDKTNASLVLRHDKDGFTRQVHEANQWCLSFTEQMGLCSLHILKFGINGWLCLILIFFRQKRWVDISLFAKGWSTHFCFFSFLLHCTDNWNLLLIGHASGGTEETLTIFDNHQSSCAQKNRKLPLRWATTVEDQSETYAVCVNPLSNNQSQTNLRIKALLATNPQQHEQMLKTSNGTHKQEWSQWEEHWSTFSPQKPAKTCCFGSRRRLNQHWTMTGRNQAWNAVNTACFYRRSLQASMAVTVTLKRKGWPQVDIIQHVWQVPREPAS